MSFARLARRQDEPAAGNTGFRLFLPRHVFAEFVKDTRRRRLGYPQLYGAPKAARRIPAIPARDRAEPGPWHQARQKEVPGWK